MLETWQTVAPPAEFREQAVAPVETDDVPICLVCGSERFEPYALGFDYELLTCSNPWRFVRCVRCHHVWLNPRPVLSALSTIYPPSYYAYNYETQINPIAVRGKEILDRFKMRAILGRLPRAPRSFLDIGCGSGRFLRTMERHGIPRQRLYGLELDERVVQDLRGQGYQAFCERIETTESIPSGSVDLATMFHVIEHVEDPGAVIRNVRRCLAPGGVFAIETPNLLSVDARLFKRTYWGGYHIPRHWHLFTPTTLSRLLKDNGLEVLAISYQTGHSFWMYSFHHLLRYNTRLRLPGLARWFDPVRGLPMLIACTGLDTVRGALELRISAMLVLAQKPD